MEGSKPEKRSQSMRGDKTQDRGKGDSKRKYRKLKGGALKKGSILKTRESKEGNTQGNEEKRRTNERLKKT